MDINDLRQQIRSWFFEPDEEYRRVCDLPLCSDNQPIVAPMAEDETDDDMHNDPRHEALT